MALLIEHAAGLREGALRPECEHVLAFEKPDEPVWNIEERAGRPAKPVELLAPEAEKIGGVIDRGFPDDGGDARRALR